MQISNANLGQTKKDYELKLTHQLQSWIKFIDTIQTLPQLSFNRNNWIDVTQVRWELLNWSICFPVTS